MLLKDRITLITGAGRGLGQSVAVAYARQGATVIAVARTQSELERTARMVEVEGAHCLTMSVDVSQEDAVQAMARQVLERFGRLDVLVNNAGVLILKTFEELSMAECDRTLAVNLRGSMLTCKCFLDSMKRQGGGSIINVSSGAGGRASCENQLTAPPNSVWRASAGPWLGAPAVQHCREYHHARQVAWWRPDQADFHHTGGVRCHERNGTRPLAGCHDID